MPTHADELAKLREDMLEEQKKAIIRRLREKIQEVEKRAAKVVRDAGIR